MSAEVSLVIRVNAKTATKAEAFDIIKKLRQSSDRMAEIAGINAVNLDYTTNWEEEVPLNPPQ